MKNTLFKKKNTLFLRSFNRYILLLLIPILFIHTVASLEMCTDSIHFEECFEENPSYANLLIAPSPNLEQFQLLIDTDPHQAALYLVSKYNDEFASEYFSQVDVDYADPYQAMIAEMFFSTDASNIQEYKQEFQEYMKSKGVSIQMIGKIKSYQQDGTIVADNGKINIKQFGDKYSFVVNDENEILLILKGSTKQYAFEGTVTQNPQGDLRIMGEGSFDGREVINSQYIRVDTEDNINIGAQQYGDLRCQPFCHMVFNPSDNFYQLKDVILADYPNFKVTGTLRLDEEYLGLSTVYTIPAGKQLEVSPIILDAKQQMLADQGYRIFANGGKDVKVALEDDTWLDHPADFVFQYIGETAVSVGLVSEESVALTQQTFEEAYQKGTEIGIVPDTKQDKVRFDTEGTVYLESTDAGSEELASYRIEMDMGAMYVTEERERKLVEQSVDFIPFPEKGQYQSGDYAEEGTEEYNAIQQIQTIVHTDSNGNYGDKTREAVFYWENNYNEKYGLTPDMEQYLSPDGVWEEENTLAYLRETKSTVAMDMRGGEAAVDLSYKGFDIFQTGAMDIEVEGIKFSYDAEGNVDKQLQEVVKNDISIPLSIVSCTKSSGSSTIAGSAITPVIGGSTWCSRFSTTETAYGLASLSEAFVDGRISQDTPLHLGQYDPLSPASASYVTGLAELEGGRYNTYGQDSQLFAEYTGQFGTAWEMSHNVRAAGGETIFLKDQGYEVGDPRLTEAVAYDQSLLHIGDNIGLYNEKSEFSEKAAATGLDGRKNTYIAKIVGKPHETYTYNGEGTSSAQFIQTQLDVDEIYLSGYPVWINSKKAVYAQGAFYYTDAKGNPEGDPITLKNGDRVDVQKTLINHLYNNPENPNAAATRLEDYGWFLSHYEDFSLYEHYRASEEKYNEADRKLSGSIAVQAYNEYQIVDAFMAQGIPVSQINDAIAYTLEINGLSGEDLFEEGDVIMIPTYQEYRERVAGTMQKNLEEHNFQNAGQIVFIATASAEERAREYNLPESEVPDLTEAMIEIAYRQKGFIPEDQWTLFSSGDDGWADIKKEFEKEQYAAYVESFTGITPETVSYGYLDTQDKIAELNARYLYEEGIISSMDYEDPTDMLDYEGSFKHGGREIAKLWNRYTEPDMPYEDKLALVGLAYNRGKDAPALLAAQYQFQAIGYPIKQKNAKYTDETINVMEKYAQDKGIPFDKTQFTQQVSDETVDFDNNPVILAMKQEYEEKTGKVPPYAQKPTRDGYVYGYSPSDFTLMKICEMYTPIKDRCAIQKS
jgi:hypothetical protein